jgi:hypothetical protein
MIKHTHTYLLLIIISILVLPLFSLAQAPTQSGCFTHPDSAYYCNNIDLEIASKECLKLEGCNLLDNFFISQDCNNNDKFSECELVLCQDSCSQSFKGNCLTGTVPKGKETEYCSEGCCRFNYGETNSCQYEEKRFLCEVEAKNKGSMTYNYDIYLTKYECDHFCEESKGISLQDLKFEKFDQDIFNLESVESDKKSVLKENNGLKQDKNGNSITLTLISIFAIIILLIYLNHQGIIKFKSLLNAIFGKKKLFPLPHLKEKSKFDFLWGGFRKRKRKGSKNTRENKRNLLLAELNLDVVKKDKSEFDKLEKIFREHLKTGGKLFKEPLSEKEEKEVEKLKKLISKESNTNNSEIILPNKKKRISKEETEKIIKELKKIRRRNS